MPQPGSVAVGGPADWTAADYRDIDTGSETLDDDERRGCFTQAPLVVLDDSRPGPAALAGPGG